MKELHFDIMYDFNELPSTQIKSLTNKAMNKVYKGDSELKEALLDPMLIMLIAQAILEIIKMVLACYESSSKATRVINSPGILARWQFKRVLKSHLGREYKKILTPAYTAMLETGKEMKQYEYDNILIELGL